MTPQPLGLTVARRAGALADRVVQALALYAVAEFQAGQCGAIRVEAQGLRFLVEDDGRGHAVDRMLGDTPYLQLIYTHFDHHAGPDGLAPVQLQGIGMSLINAMCSELHLTARKRDKQLRMSFRDGALAEHELSPHASDATGNAMAGLLDAACCAGGVNEDALRDWLLDLAAAAPSLKLSFNGEALRGNEASDPPSAMRNVSPPG